MRLSYTYLILAFMGSCAPKKSNHAVVEFNSDDIWPVISNKIDTIMNGSVYETKVYFTNDSLLDVAKSQNIKKYLVVFFADDTSEQGTLSTTNEANYNGDTALIRFKVDVENIGIHSYFYWQLNVGLDFDPSVQGIDTTFFDVYKIVVKNTGSRDQ